MVPAAPEPQAHARETLRALALLGAFACVLTLVLYVATISWSGPFPRDATSLVVGRDFLNNWMYGRAAFASDPGQFYDVARYQQALATIVGADYPGQGWSYPPSVMLLFAPFAALGYLPALAAWTTVNLAVFLAVSHQLVERRVLIIVLVSPAALLSLMAGQSSLLTAAMLVTIFAWLDRRPIGAGIIIGLLTLKPQLGLLFPVMLIASRRWTVFAAAAATAIAIAIVTAAVWGPQIWIDFVRVGSRSATMLLVDPDMRAAAFQTTIFMNARVAGASYEVAMVLQGMVALAAAATVAWTYHARRNGDPLLLATLFLACSVSITPYFMSYDLVAVSLFAVSLIAAGRLDVTGHRLVHLVYWLPLIQVVFATHLPGPALIPPAFAIYLLTRLKTGTAGAPAIGDPSAFARTGSSV
jgi:hypothetical protein